MPLRSVAWRSGLREGATVTRYSVETYRVHVNAAGRVVSFYGALPWWNEAQRIAEGWRTEDRGFTIADRDTNTVGLGRAPFTTRAEAEAFAAKANADDAARRAEHAAAWAPVNRPIAWTRARGDDGTTRHHSGEGYAIACQGGAYVVECDGSPVPDLRPFPSLAKAKAWAERQIRSARQAATFGA
jgi:hypothetical protein